MPDQQFAILSLAMVWIIKRDLLDIKKTWTRFIERHAMFTAVSVRLECMPFELHMHSIRILEDPDKRATRISHPAYEGWADDGSPTLEWCASAPYIFFGALLRSLWILPVGNACHERRTRIVS